MFILIKIILFIDLATHKRLTQGRKLHVFVDILTFSQARRSCNACIWSVHGDISSLYGLMVCLTSIVGKPHIVNTAIAYYAFKLRFYECLSVFGRCSAEMAGRRLMRFDMHTHVPLKMCA